MGLCVRSAYMIEDRLKGTRLGRARRSALVGMVTLLYGLSIDRGESVGQEFFVPHTAVELLVSLPRRVLFLALQDGHLAGVCSLTGSDFLLRQLERLAHFNSPSG